MNRATGVSNLRFSTDSVESLRNISGRLLESMVISIYPSDMETLDAVLSEIPMAKEEEAGTELQIAIYEPEIGRQALFHSNIRVKLDKPTIMALNQLDIKIQFNKKQTA